jgi:hypothetical protein
MFVGFEPQADGRIGLQRAVARHLVEARFDLGAHALR